MTQETGGTSADGSWVVVLVGPGGLDETRCISSQDVQDPTEISSANWMCESSLAKGRTRSIGQCFSFMLWWCLRIDLAPVCRIVTVLCVSLHV